MKYRYKFIVISIVVLLLSSCSDYEPNCPDFALRDIDGDIVELHDLLEEGPVVINIWALWCRMCIKELDALNPYYDEFTTYGIEIVAISQDKERSIPDVMPFVLSHEWKFLVLLDPDSRIRELFDIEAMPTILVYNQQGDLVFKHMGYKPGDEEIIIDTLRALYGNE